MGLWRDDQQLTPARDWDEMSDDMDSIRQRVYVLHGDEPGTIVGVYASLELAQQATEATEWYRSLVGPDNDNSWQPGPGPDAQLSITEHTLLGEQPNPSKPNAPPEDDAPSPPMIEALEVGVLEQPTTVTFADERERPPLEVSAGSFASITIHSEHESWGAFMTRQEALAVYGWLGALLGATPRR